MPFDQLARQNHKRQHVHSRVIQSMFCAGALGLLLGFFLPFVYVNTPSTTQVTGFVLASTRAINLWTVPAVAMTVLWLVWRRRSYEGLHSARVALFFLGLMPLVSVAYTLRGVMRWANRVNETTQPVTWHPAIGLYVIGAASVVMMVAVVRYGAMSRWPA